MTRFVFFAFFWIAYGSIIERIHRPKSDSHRYSPARLQRIIRRDAISSFLHVETTGFNIYLTCHLIEESICNYALSDLKRAALRIQGVIYLNEQIRVNVTFGSFSDSSRTLGYASPNFYVEFHESEDLPWNVDADYLYPAALARQLAPDESSLQTSKPDIDATFNSDYNWWFADSYGFARDIDAESEGSKRFDFEQVAIHELLHGMGFISGWYTWFGDKHSIPSFPLYSDDGDFKGLAKPFIFDRWVSDAIHGFWLRDIGKAITEDYRHAARVANESNATVTWRSVFAASEGAKISAALIQAGGPFVTPRALWSWYPVIENDAIVFRYAILYTPAKYTDGSSISHFDDQFYSSTSHFLMRPFAVEGVGLDGYVPYNKLGPLSEIIIGIFKAIGYSTL
jgi:hypothetical protein